MQSRTVFSLQVSRLGIGTVQFGFDYGIRNRRGQVSFDDIVTILDQARKAGVNFLDTSRLYGDSEKRIGEALKKLQATKDFVICTKLDLPKGYAELSDSELLRAAKSSLYASMNELGVGVIPIYLLHQYPYKTLRGGVLWDFVQEERRKGTILHGGISIGNGPSEALEAMADESVEILQIPFNIFDTRWHKNGVPQKASEQGVALFSRSTYLQGLMLMELYEVQQQLPFALPFVQRLQELSRELDMDVQELVLGYAAGEPALFSSVLGVDSPGQFAENLARFEYAAQVLEERLSEGEHSALGRVGIRNRFDDVPEQLVDPSQWHKPYQGSQ